jgi:hypothetical protein
MFHGYPEITPSKLGAGVRGWKVEFHTRFAGGKSD